MEILDPVKKENRISKNFGCLKHYQVVTYSVSCCLGLNLGLVRELRK